MGMAVTWRERGGAQRSGGETTCVCSPLNEGRTQGGRSWRFHGQERGGAFDETERLQTESRGFICGSGTWERGRGGFQHNVPRQKLDRQVGRSYALPVLRILYFTRQ